MAQGMLDEKQSSESRTRLLMLPPARVLAAVDFSESSRSALSCAARLAQQYGAELHILHVPHPLLSGASDVHGASINGHTRGAMIDFALSAPPASMCTPQHHVVPGDAPSVIRDVAHRESCDVVVVGVHGLSGDDPFPYGTTTEALLRDADLPLLVVADEWDPVQARSKGLAGTGPVIAALDFTCPSIAAATAGADLAASLQTGLLLVHVVTPLQAPAPCRDEVEAIVQRQVVEASARMAQIEPAFRARVPVECRVEVGAVAPTLADFARTMPTAILVLGRARHSREYGPPGTIASRVLARGRLPLLLQIPSR
jgi:nucleotide-binding universal stress UspA family protein